jgi:hypothetical protein
MKLPYYFLIPFFCPKTISWPGLDEMDKKYPNVGCKWVVSIQATETGSCIQIIRICSEGNQNKLLSLDFLDLDTYYPVGYHLRREIGYFLPDSRLCRTKSKARSQSPNEIKHAILIG